MPRAAVLRAHHDRVESPPLGVSRRAHRHSFRHQPRGRGQVTGLRIGRSSTTPAPTLVRPDPFRHRPDHTHKGRVSHQLPGRELPPSLIVYAPGHVPPAASTPSRRRSTSGRRSSGCLDFSYDRGSSDTTSCARARISRAHCSPTTRRSATTGRNRRRAQAEKAPQDRRCGHRRERAEDALSARVMD